MKYWIRWALVLPGALIGAFLATFPLHWILYLLFSPSQEADFFSFKFFLGLFPSDLNAKSIEYIIYPAVMAIFFIITGYKIAPKYKFKTALLLFGLYIGVWLTSYILVSSNLIYGVTISGVRPILALLGACLGLYQAKLYSRKEPEK